MHEDGLRVGGQSPQALARALAGLLEQQLGMGRPARINLVACDAGRGADDKGTGSYAEAFLRELSGLLQFAH